MYPFSSRDSAAFGDSVVGAGGRPMPEGQTEQELLHTWVVCLAAELCVLWAWPDLTTR